MSRLSWHWHDDQVEPPRGSTPRTTSIRTLRRLCLYNVAAWNPEPDPYTDGHLLIVDHLPPVSGRHAARWPTALTAEHHSALARHHQTDRSA